jgi:glucose/arabinose dehydrogenase
MAGQLLPMVLIMIILLLVTSSKKEGVQDPEYWAPSIAPSGMAFISSDIYPNWKGNLLVGSLKFQYVEMLTFTGTKLLVDKNRH